MWLSAKPICVFCEKEIENTCYEVYVNGKKCYRHLESHEEIKNFVKWGNVTDPTGILTD